MDFGASAVWGDAPSLSSSTQPSAPTISLFAPSKEDPFDDFDEFGDDKEVQPAQSMEEDDFGDFGDFAEDTVAPDEGGQYDSGFGFADSDLQTTALRNEWNPLRLDPVPDTIDLTEQVQELLSGVVQGPDIDAMLTGEGIRQIESTTQLLVSPDRYVGMSILWSKALIASIQPFSVQNLVRRSCPIS